MKTKFKILIFIITFFCTLTFLYSDIAFRFCVLGDSRTQTEIFNECLRQISELQPSPYFVFNVGDFINGYKDDIKEIEEEWRLMYFEPIKRYLKLSIIHYPVPGNHDIFENGEAYEFYLKNVFPYTYYYFVFNNCLFIALSSEEIGQAGRISDSQYKWLEKVLERFEKENFIKHKFIFVHRPFFPYKSHLDDSLNQDSIMLDKIMKLFKKSGVDVIFAGHCHLYHKSFHNGILQIITGGAGAPLHSKKENEGIYHFLIVDVFENNFKIFLKNIKSDKLELIYQK